MNHNKGGKMAIEIPAGIDLGTINTAIAYFDKKMILKVAKSREGEYTIPSVVYYPLKGPAVVGREGKNCALLYPGRVILQVKRFMGKTLPDGKPFIIFKDTDGTEYTPESDSAFILKKAVTDCEAFSGGKVGPVAISVPAYFQDPERNATLNAGKIAGLEVVGLINEPTAAALAYGLDKGKDQIILNFDLGGGTFDVSILSIEGKKITVKTTDGVRLLGGIDFDDKLIARIVEKAKEKGVTIDPKTDAAIRQEIRDRAEKMKVSLSTMQKALFTANLKSKQVSFELTRAEFEDMTKDLLEKAMEKTTAVVKASSFNWKDINIVLVGGATRMPMISKSLEQLSGKKPLCDADPDLIVAKGTAIAGVKMAQQNGKKVFDLGGSELDLPGVEFVNVASHALGCAAFARGTDEERFCPIIPKNTPVPVVKKDHFGLKDKKYQSMALVKAYQGEERLPLDKCLKIGEVLLKDLPVDDREDRIEVTYAYNRDGIVEVTVRDLVSGKSTKGKIEHKAGLTQKDIEQAKGNLEKKFKPEEGEGE